MTQKMDPISAGGGAVVTIALAGMAYLYKLAAARRAPPTPANGSVVPDQRMRDVLYGIKGKVEDLHNWHDVVDEDGVRRWYNRRSTEQAIRETASNSAKAVDLLAELVKEMKRRNSDRPR